MTIEEIKTLMTREQAGGVAVKLSDRIALLQVEELSRMNNSLEKLLGMAERAEKEAHPV